MINTMTTKKWDDLSDNRLITEASNITRAIVLHRNALAVLREEAELLNNYISERVKEKTCL